MALTNAESWLFWLGKAKLVAAFLVAAGVAIEFIGDWVSAPYEKAVKDAYEKEMSRLSIEADTARASIADANKQTELAKRDAAIAEQHANEAKLELERFRAPRRLSSDQKLELTNRMKEFSGTKFAISSASGSEAVHFSVDIADALVAAGLQWINWPLGGIATKPPGGRPEMGLDLMAGMEAHIFSDSKKPVAAALFEGLSNVGFVISWVILPPPNPTVADTIIIIVGSKE